VPFTPYHFGPGLFLKSLAPRRFSFLAFVATQVVIDVETLVFLLRGQFPVHRTAHTFLGGSLIGLGVAGVLYGAAAVIRHWPVWRLPALFSELTWEGLLIGGLTGGASHALLDGLTHRDIRPLRPFSDANPLLGLVSLEALHVACVALGVVGLIWLALRRPLWQDQGTTSER